MEELHTEPNFYFEMMDAAHCGILGSSGARTLARLLVLLVCKIGEGSVQFQFPALE
jgi:hypothetical protein